jgi:AAA ATPase domain
MRPRGVGGLARAFVGRERDLERLYDAYRAAVEHRRPRLVTILGDAGVGKTRFVRELWQWLPEQKAQPLCRTGRCLSYGTGTAYWALGEVLKEHLGLLESDRQSSRSTGSAAGRFSASPSVLMSAVICIRLQRAIASKTRGASS